jgi:hypothetical protein
MVLGPQLNDVLAIRRHKGQGVVGIQPAVGHNSESSHAHPDIHATPSMYIDPDNLVPGTARLEYKAGDDTLHPIEL